MAELSSPTGGRLVSTPLGEGVMVTTVETYNDRVVLHVRSSADFEPVHVLATHEWSVTDDLGTSYTWLGGGGSGGPTADWLFTAVCWEPAPPPEATELRMAIPDWGEGLRGLQVSVALPART